VSGKARLQRLFFKAARRFPGVVVILLPTPTQGKVSDDDAIAADSVEKNALWT